MSPFDLTNLAALKAWLGLPSAPGPNDATLARAHYGGEPFDLRVAEPSEPAAVLLCRDD